MLEVIIQETKVGEKEYVLVRCQKITPELSDLLDQIKDYDRALIAFADNEIHRINPSDVFYVESVDKKIFLYCESVVYESKQRLYEFEEMLNPNVFMRISKSTIVNLSKIKSLSIALYGRLEVTLANSEKVFATRTHAERLRGKLEL
ncbi:MAG: LytTR family transcriptional regulator [Defluviitaleaceae bacterium]|nr:LytTR family transcriptional regulator [Defluviitaleaceae bacterium]